MKKTQGLTSEPASLQNTDISPRNHGAPLGQPKGQTGLWVPFGVRGVVQEAS